MTWVIVAVAAVAVLPFLFSRPKPKKTSESAKFISSGNSTEDSRQLLDGLVQENRKRWAALPDSTVTELIDAQRRDIESIWNIAYRAAVKDGKDTAFATHFALLRVASFLIIGEDKGPDQLTEGLVLEVVPFKGLPPEEAKAAAVEYCISKYNPSKADSGIVVRALLQFADETFEAANEQSNPDAYIYEMIYRETLDWQKVLAEALSTRNKEIA